MSKRSVKFIKSIALFCCILVFVASLFVTGCSKETGEQINSATVKSSATVAAKTIGGPSTATATTSKETAKATEKAGVADISSTASEVPEISESTSGGDTADVSEDSGYLNEQDVVIADLEEKLGESNIDLGGYKLMVSCNNLFNMPVDEAAGQYGMLDVFIQKMNAAQKKYNFTIEQVLNSNQTQRHEQFLSYTMAGIKYCDVFFTFSSDMFPKFVTQNVILPVSDYIDFETPIIKANKVMYNGTYWNGKHYGIAFRYDLIGYLVAYNSDMLSREGLPDILDLYFTGQWTWNEMLDIAIKCTRDTNGDGILDQYGITVSNGNPWTFMQGILYSNGIAAIDFEGGNPVFALGESKAMRTLQFVSDMVFVNKVFIKTNSEYNKGKVAMIIITGLSTNTSYLKAGVNSITCPLPMGPDVNTPQNFSNSQFYAMSVLCERPADIAKIWTEASIQWTEDSQPIPEIAEANRKYYADDWLWSTDNPNRYFSQAREFDARNSMAIYYKTDFTNGYPGLAAYLQNNLSTPIFDGSKSVAQAVDSVSAYVQDLIDQFK